ncbi:MAG TPA: hypothetical protein VMD59_15275, partial [Acidimicrobiales bacterium]|nr:hypothetical protein [Acidimicrobiales bacterium]
ISESIPGTAKDGGIASTDTDCIYSDPNAKPSASNPLASFEKTVYLSRNIPTHPVTTSQIQAAIDEAESEAASEAHVQVKLLWKPYAGLPFQAWSFSFGIVEEGMSIGITGVLGVSGEVSTAHGPGWTVGFGAVIFDKNVALSKVAALCKLAQALT